MILRASVDSSIEIYEISYSNRHLIQVVCCSKSAESKLSSSLLLRCIYDRKWIEVTIAAGCKHYGRLIRVSNVACAGYCSDRVHG